MNENEKAAEKLEAVRKATTEAIVAVAQARYVLEEVRNRLGVAPEEIHLASHNYRAAESRLKEAIETEIKTVTDVVIERASKLPQTLAEQR